MSSIGALGNEVPDISIYITLDVTVPFQLVKISSKYPTKGDKNHMVCKASVL